MRLSSFFRTIFHRSDRDVATESDDSLLQQARERQQGGDVEGARTLCLQVLERHPRQASALCLLGMLCGQSGNLEEALSRLQEAVTLDPELADAHIGLGNVYMMLNDGANAEVNYRAALARNPESPTGNYNLGLCMKSRGQYEAALGNFDRARQGAPELLNATVEYARCLILLGRFQPAITLLKETVESNRENASVWKTMGDAHLKMHEAAAAMECYEAARRLGGAAAEFYCSLGMAQHELGRIGEAEASYDQALALQPDFPLARFHRSLSRLIRGDYARGWPDYELRLISEDRLPRAVSFPRWQGEPLHGRTILVYGEQGLGDEIMFASCLPQIIGAAGRCIVESAPKLEHLFRRSFPEATVYAALPNGSIPPGILDSGIDLEAAIGSLPLYLRKSPRDFPAHDGFLEADPERIARWRQRLQDLGPGLKVGISWRGGTYNTRSPLRSIALARLRPLFACPGARFVSLQYADPTQEIAALAAQHNILIEHWPDAIAEYEETAALICALDVVVSVCTAAVHLSGALGARVLVMAPYCPEWRYGLAGDTIPWYPSATIFRQPEPGAWDPVITRVTNALHGLASSNEGVRSDD